MKQKIPPPEDASFSVMVQLVMVGEEESLRIPPPPAAPFEVKAQFLMVGEELVIR